METLFLSMRQRYDKIIVKSKETDNFSFKRLFVCGKTSARFLNTRNEFYFLLQVSNRKKNQVRKQPSQVSPECNWLIHSVPV